MSKSILHNKDDGTCYLCMLLNNDYNRRTRLQEHHVFLGRKERKLAERYGLKVYLCLQHHTAGRMAVHNNYKLARLLQEKAQQEFEKRHSAKAWMAVFGRNYRTEPFGKI